MNLTGRCKRCNRDLHLDQLLRPGTYGRCPWCGAMLVRHYTPLLPRLVEEAQAAGTELGRILRLLSSGWCDFEINEASVLRPIESSFLDRPEKAVRDEASAPVVLTRGRADERAA